MSDALPRFVLHGPDAADLAPGTWLLEASAGTGKTYTIVAIVLRLVVEAEVPIERCVVMTFTRAATAELRERLRRGLHEALDVLDDDRPPRDTFLHALWRRHRREPLARQRLQLALAGLDAALIATIHGVCRRLLADHALGAGVALDAELDNDNEQWRRDQLHDQLRDWSRRLSPAAASLVGAAFDPERLLERCRVIERQPSVVFAGAEPISAAQVEDLLAELRRNWPQWRTAIAAFFAERAAVLGGVDTYAPRRLDERLQAIGDELADIPSMPRLHELVRPIVDPNHARERFGQSRLRQLQATAWHRLLLRLVRLTPGIERQILCDYREAVRHRPHRTRHLQYNDLIGALMGALDGPGGPALQAAVRSRYAVALVDEFQDTDPQQWATLDRLFGGPAQRLFLIGDPKQAIYAFRGADVHAYLAVSRDRDLHAATLATNHRSDPGLVAALNHCFDRGPQAFVDPGIVFSPVEAAQGERLRLAPGLDPRPLQIWWQEPASTIADTRATLAAACAAEIVRLLTGAQRQSSGGWCDLQPRDIAVLVRSHHDGELIARALAELPQPVACVRTLRQSVFASRVAFELALVLEAVLAPHRDRTVRAAALTRFAGLSAAELIDEAQATSIETLVGGLHRLRSLWRQRGFVTAWQDLLDHGCTGRSPRVLLAASSDGERALTDLLQLGDLLIAADGDGRLGPEALLDWLQARIAAPGSDADEELQRLDRDDQAVHILTIHAAKGLQWPVVFAPFLWAGHRVDEDQLYHQDHDARLWFGARPVKIEALQRREALAETLRLAYVALTRAEHRCYTAIAPQASRTGQGCFNAAPIWLGWGVAHCQPEDLATTVKARVADPAWQEALRDAYRHEHIHLGAPPSDATQRLQLVLDRDGLREQAIAPWRPRPRRRWFSSYSGLVRDRPVDEPDHDQLPAPEGGSDDDLPRGARFGTALHAVFEHLPPGSDRAHILALCREALAAQGFPAEHAPRLAVLVERTLAHHLPGSAVPLGAAWRQRSAELEVLLPVTGSGQLAAAFRAHGGPWADYAATIADLQVPGGFFTGIIDLVFHHAGRFHVLDWKSNDLARRGGYHPEALRAEMLHHHYVLQYHLYLLALHRLLRLRQPGYDYQRHVGAAHYVFVRGIGAEPADPAAWYTHRPSAAMIAALDACFGTPDGTEVGHG